MVVLYLLSTIYRYFLVYSFGISQHAKKSLREGEKEVENVFWATPFGDLQCPYWAKTINPSPSLSLLPTARIPFSLFNALITYFRSPSLLVTTQLS